LGFRVQEKDVEKSNDQICHRIDFPDGQQNDCVCHVDLRCAVPVDVEIHARQYDLRKVGMFPIRLHICIEADFSMYGLQLL